MQSKDRNGNIVSEEEGQDRLLETLYGTAAGRGLVKLLVNPAVSKAGGNLLDRGVSKLLVSPFIEKNHIAMEQYEDEEYESFNHFFTRKVREGERSFSGEPEVLCAPCDGRLSVYPVTADGVFRVKGTEYTMHSLLRNRALAEKYDGGTLCIFRLCVDDYHRFCYVDDGIKTKNYRIEGVFHTVNPAAGDRLPVYQENTREFSVLKSRNFGCILMMEVGAMLVGRIVNHHEKAQVRRGMEKGLFEYGGSTVILAFQKGMVTLDSDIQDNTENGFETLVKMGEAIGRKTGV